MEYINVAFLPPKNSLLKQAALNELKTLIYALLEHGPQFIDGRTCNVTVNRAFDKKFLEEGLRLR